MGAFGALIDVRCEWDRGSAMQQLCVNWSTHGCLTISPSVVFFGNVGKGTDVVSRKVLVRRNDAQPLHLTKLKSGNPAVSCRITSVLDNGCVLELTLDPSRMEGGALIGQLQAETDHPRLRQLKLEFSALK